MEATNNIQTGGVSSFSVQEIKQYPFSPFLDINAEPADRDLQKILEVTGLDSFSMFAISTKALNNKCRQYSLSNSEATLLRHWRRKLKNRLYGWKSRQKRFMLIEQQKLQNEKLKIEISKIKSSFLLEVKKKNENADNLGNSTSLINPNYMKDSSNVLSTTDCCTVATEGRWQHDQLDDMEADSIDPYLHQLVREDIEKHLNRRREYDE